jgi:calcineurin-like phosphoesterase family protein
MNKKNTIIIVGLVVVLLLIVINFVGFNKGYKITITNNTDKTVVNLDLKYKVGDIIKTIPQIEPKKSWKDNIDTSSIQGENAMILAYKDNKGNSYEECVVGYLEKGYNGKASIVINKIDDNGKLELEVK